MASDRARQLEKLALSLPMENQQFARQQQEARLAQLQQQMSTLSPGTGGVRTAQQLGAQQARQAGDIQLKAAQQTQAQTQVLGQEALAEQARAKRGRGFELTVALNQQQRQAANRLNRIDIQLKNNLLDQQLQFKQTQAGQALFNERQLADWAIAKAQSQEEYANYAQAATQMYQRELQILETANKKLEQILKQNYIKENKPLDREMRRQLTEQKAALELSIKKKENAAKNRISMWQVGGQILGAGVAMLSTLGAPAALAAATIGGGITSTLAGLSDG